MSELKRFILIDDDDIFVYLTKKVLERTKLVDIMGVFGNGLDAINYLKDNKQNADLLPDIILLDLNMPIMNGWQFLEEYVAHNSKMAKKVLIYICSSSISPDDIMRAKTINAVSDYIIKPITTDKLMAIVKPT